MNSSGKMPAETKTTNSTGVENETPTKKKSASYSSKAAVAQVTLLDGSQLEVTIEVS